MLFARLRVLFALQDQIRALQAQVGDLGRSHDTLDLAFQSFRGRVYAWRRGETPYPQPETASQNAAFDPRTADPNDPSLTKHQAKAALKAQGRLKPN